jgi:hypothetical protein
LADIPADGSSTDKQIVRNRVVLFVCLVTHVAFSESCATVQISLRFSRLHHQAPYPQAMVFTSPLAATHVLKQIETNAMSRACRVEAPSLIRKAWKRPEILGKENRVGGGPGMQVMPIK